MSLLTLYQLNLAPTGPPTNVYSGSVALTIAVASTYSGPGIPTNAYSGAVNMTMAVASPTAADRAYTGSILMTLGITSPTSLTGGTGSGGPLIFRRRRREAVLWPQ